jgi:hypothetical protein
MNSKLPFGERISIKPPLSIRVIKLGCYLLN